MRIGLLSLEKHGHPHTSRNAERRDTPLRPPPAQLMEQGRGDARAGGADGMSERDRAAVDVDAAEIEREVPGTGDDLGGERLVQLDQIDVRQPELRLVEKRAD